MIDFDRWFTQAGRAAPVPRAPEFPDGVYEKEGKYFSVCRSCDSSYELPCDPDEFTDEGNYCGRSPRCLP